MMQQQTRAILRFLRHYMWELTIAFVLAVLAAVLFDLYQERTAAHKLQKNKAAVAEVFAYSMKGELVGTGSGFFLRPDGILATNFHVIEGAARLEARLPSGSFYKLKAVLAADKDRDIAILQFDGDDTPAVKLGDSDSIEAGQPVVTIGHPLGLSAAVSDGIISNPKLKWRGWDFVQFTAPISLGNSGGGLFDKKNGDLIGVTSATLNIREGEQKGAAQNLNLAIPVNVVKAALHGDDVTLTGESPAYFYALGSLAEAKRDFKIALEDYQQAVALAERQHDEHAGVYYLALGGMNYEFQKYQLELENYLKATKADPNNTDAWYYLATAYEDTGDYRSAVDTYRVALRFEPKNKEALHDLALLHLAMGDKASASGIVSRLTPLDPGVAKKLRLLLGNQR